VAYVAVTSIAVIGLYIAYAIPILLRQFAPDFKPGPWRLGAWSRPIGWIAVIWVAFVSVLFMLPTATPITLTNFNYTPVVVLGVIVLVTIWWLASARFWFKGPIIQGSEAELEAIEKSVGETVSVEGMAAGGE
jgi:hypothetical protein